MTAAAAQTKPQHWLRRLPEVGSPFQRRAELIEAQALELARLHQALTQAEMALFRMEEEAEAEALTLWTADEIRAAKSA